MHDVASVETHETLEILEKHKRVVVVAAVGKLYAC